MNFVDAHDFSVDLVLRALDIPAFGYYGWRARRANTSRRQASRVAMTTAYARRECQARGIPVVEDCAYALRSRMALAAEPKAAAQRSVAAKRSGTAQSTLVCHG